MELKKSPKADLQSKKSFYFQIGLVIALLAVIGVFSVSQAEKVVERVVTDAPMIEPDVIEITRPEEPKSPLDMPKQTVKVMSEILNIVKNDTKIVEDMQFADADENFIVQTVDYGGTAEGVLEGDDIPFFHVEQMPKFQGGDVNKFRSWVFSKVRYPELAQQNNIQGRVMLSFVIERDGTLTNIEIITSPDRLLSDEAVRVVKSSPKWEPGKQRGTPVRVKYNLPVDFRIN